MLVQDVVSGGIHMVKADKYCLTQSYTKIKDKNLYPSSENSLFYNKRCS